MGIAWVDRVANNSSKEWFFTSVDDRNNGALDGGGRSFVLDGGAPQSLSPNTQYSASWCGIPWYFEGKHYKVLSQSRTGGVLFYTSEVNGRNWITFQDLATLTPLFRQEVPKGVDFHCNIRIMDSPAPGSFIIDVVNVNQYSGEKLLFEILGEAKQLVPLAVDAAVQLIGTAGALGGAAAAAGATIIAAVIAASS